MENEWQEKYRKMMEREYFSKRKKEDMVKKLIQVSKGGEATVDNRYVPRNDYLEKRFWKKGVVAACLIGCLFLTGVANASAAGLLKPVSDVLAKIFHLTPNDEGLTGEIGKPLNQSAVSNGIRVTADAVITDSYAYAVVFSIEREDGRPLGNGQDLTSDNWYFANENVEVATQNGIGPIWGEYYSYDETPEDSSIQYVMIAYGDDKIKTEGNISVHLSDLYHLGMGGSKDYTIKGNWDMELSFPETSDELVVKEKNKRVNLDGNWFTIEDIRISPVSYHLTFSISADSGLGAADGAKILDHCTMELELKDGENITLGEGGSAVKDSIQFVYGDIFKSLVHLEDIKAIHIGKLEIPVQME